MNRQIDAIAVLSAGIKRKSGRWVSTDLTEEDDALGAPGGTLRIHAAAVFAKRYPGAIVIASGGKGFDVPEDMPKDRPLLCEIIGDELREAGVPSERLLFEGSSDTTYQQLGAIGALMREHGWKYLIVVTNRWHVPRTRIMLKSYFPHLADGIQLESAEEVLIADNKEKWESSIARAYASDFLHRRIEREEAGIRQIKEGIYDFR